MSTSPESRTAPPALRVLCLEDDPADAELNVLELKKAGYAVEATLAKDRASFAEALAGGEFDVILADYGLPGWNGLDAYKLLKETGKELPFILVTGTLGDELAVECVKQGISDYVIKQRLVRLPFAVERACRTLGLQREHEMANEELRRREARFRSLIEHGHDLICLAAADGTVLYLSPSVQRILGYAPEEVIGRNGFELIMREDRERCTTLFREALDRPGKVYQVSFLVRHKDGTARMMELIGSNLLQDPDVGAMVLNQRDVTDRCRVEEDLRRSERKYRELFELANEAILIFEPASEIILEANPYACAMYGYPYDELLGMSLKRLTSDVQRGERQIEELLAAGSWQNFNTTHIRRDGTLIHLLASSKLIEYAGQPAILTINHDITELKQAEEALRYAHDELEKRVEERTAELARVNAELSRSRDEWQATFDCMSDAVTVHDTDFRIVRCNRAFRELYPDADFSSVRCFELVHGSSAPPEMCPLNRTLASQQTEVCEMYEARLGRFISIRTDPMFNEDGKVSRVVHVISDISERKEIDRMKNEFVGRVSHELRTPLSSLRGFAELMLEHEYPQDKQHRFLEVIKRESERLGRLINDMLDIQRIESGQQVLRYQAVSLAALAAETTEALSSADRAHQIVIAIEPDLPPVRADADSLHQVLNNLVSNALKYSPDGGEVRVAARREGAEVLVAVSDTGVGIPAEALPRVFSKFYRVDNSATRKIGGTGLGLALVKDIVEMHGGRVWVESQLRKGSTFYFTLPRWEPSVEVPAA